LSPLEEYGGVTFSAGVETRLLQVGEIPGGRIGRFSLARWFGAFSVSPSHLNPLKQYIADQEMHHQRETFQDEFRRLCRKYGVEIDEGYVWD
jgi:hypothetical protein